MIYVLVILFIIIVLYCLFGNPSNVLDHFITKCKPLKQEQVRSNFDVLREDLTQLYLKENESLYNKIKSCIDSFDAKHNDDVDVIASKIKELRILINSILQIQNKLLVMMDSLIQSDNNTIALKQGKVTPENSNPIYPLQMYSEMIDSMLPLGFYKANLKSTSIGCAFKIMLNDDRTGTFQFVEDPNIQMEILSAFNPIVTESSEYDSVPATPTKIILVEPGMLYLENGIWIIKKKQIINFA